MDRVNIIISWYQQKIGTYDKQLWERSVEKEVLKSIEKAPKKSARVKPELIDVDLVRGSTFPKTKPQHGWLEVSRIGLQRAIFLPFYFRWWHYQTSVWFALLLLLLYLLEVGVLVIYYRDTGPSLNAEFLSLAHLVSPLVMMVALSLIHGQIFATHESHRQRPRLPGKRASSIRPKKRSARRHRSGPSSSHESRESGGSHDTGIDTNPDEDSLGKHGQQGNHLLDNARYQREAAAAASEGARLRDKKSTCMNECDADDESDERTARSRRCVKAMLNEFSQTNRKEEGDEEVPHSETNSYSANAQSDAKCVDDLTNCGAELVYHGREEDGDVRCLSSDTSVATLCEFSEQVGSLLPVAEENGEAVSNGCDYKSHAVLPIYPENLKCSALCQPSKLTAGPDICDTGDVADDSSTTKASHHSRKVGKKSSPKNQSTKKMPESSLVDTKVLSAKIRKRKTPPTALDLTCDQRNGHRSSCESDGDSTPNIHSPKGHRSPFNHALSNRLTEMRHRSYQSSLGCARKLSPDGPQTNSDAASSELEWEDTINTEMTSCTDTSSRCSSGSELSEKDLDDDVGLGPSTSSVQHVASVMNNLASSTDRVSCMIWEGEDVKKVDLTVLDVGWSIIQRVDIIPETSDYVVVGLVLSSLLMVMPVVFRLYHSWHKVSLVGLSLSLSSVSDLTCLLFGDNWKQMLIVMNGTVQRICLSLILFFLLSVAERTFKQRLLYAKHFCYLTSCRRAKKYDLPHFRLNKVRNIKTWLSLRSYLKKRGPQRSVDTIVSATFILEVCLVSVLSYELLENSGDFVEHLGNWELVLWCMGLGLYLLRFMTLGTKINRKYRNFSVLITEQINLYLHMEKKPHKKEELMLANSVLKLAEDLLKELESPFKISGLSANPFLYNITKVIILSAFSAVLTELLGFKLKLYKIKIRT